MGDELTAARRELWRLVMTANYLHDSQRRGIAIALVEYEDALRVSPERRPRRVRTKPRGIKGGARG